MVRVLTAAGLITFLSCGAFGQPSATPAFESASVKPSAAGNRRGGMRTEADGFTARSVTLQQLIVFAYGLDSHQLSGPGWIETERYDVTGKAEGPATPAQLRSMLQALVEDRFQLKFHRETKELPVYWLVVAQNGPRLRDAKQGEDAFNASTQGGKSPFKPGIEAIFKGGQLSDFAERLSRPLDRPILDKTGIQGRYWFQLEWAPDPSPEGTAAAGRGPLHAGPSLLAALQEQLGLTLEARNAPMDILVIDHVQKP